MSGEAYYNEFDPFCADWLRNLIAAGHLPAGRVDVRDLRDVRADEPGPIAHFFAGIGGWPYAIALAGWPADRPVWTGSCPCQPFSTAGKRRGSADPRHLWPTWFTLIRERHPDTIFGEQVASAVGHGWLDDVSADLEREGYAVGAAVLGAHSVGAPHIRQRLFWVADRSRTGLAGRAQQPARQERAAVERGRDAGWLDDSTRVGRREGIGDVEAPEASGLAGGHAASPSGGLGNTDGRGRDGEPVRLRQRRQDQAGPETPWAGCEYLPCADGKARPTQPGLHPLAYGVPGRVGRLRAYGNAIVPKVAAEFVRAFMESLPTVAADKATSVVAKKGTADPRHH